MGHKPVSELENILELAKNQIPVGSKRSHYKHPELYYEVKSIVIYEADDDAMVIYQGPNGVPFARSLSIFLEKVDIDGEKIQRFTRIT